MGSLVDFGIVLSRRRVTDSKIRLMKVWFIAGRGVSELSVSRTYICRTFAPSNVMRLYCSLASLRAGSMELSRRMVLSLHLMVRGAVFGWDVLEEEGLGYGFCLARRGV